MVENVIPTLRGRLWRRADAAVGIQLLQRADAVPQHVLSTRPDYGYWYAPGAIYQYDPGDQPDHVGRGADVAGLLDRPAASDGLRHVQRAHGLSRTYYDTPNAWYRYNNGYIYQVDPTTQLVTAIVASLLT